MGKAKQRRAPKEKASQRGVDADLKAVNRMTNGHRASQQQLPTINTATDPSIFGLFIYLLKVILCTACSTPFWFLTTILSLVYGRPPKMVHPTQTLRYLRYTINNTCDHLPDDGDDLRPTLQPQLSFRIRLELVMTILLHSATSPVSGFFWLIDEFLYGNQLNDDGQCSIDEPLFVVSAYRSASTQMARMLASDSDRFVAPNAIMCAFPYLWLWNLVTWIIGDDAGISKDEYNGYLNKNFPKESLERHDNDHFAIDTFDGYFLSSHLNGLAFQLGPTIMANELNVGRFEEHNRYLFENDFVEHVDRIARKTLLFHNVSNNDAHHGTTRRRTFLLKGHFLCSAPALRKRYPNARFLSVLRDPLDRIRSGIHHAAVNPTLFRPGRPVRWDWLAMAFGRMEVDYCLREMEWYGGDSDDDDDDNDGDVVRRERRLAVKFDSFVKGIGRTMTRVYLELLECDEKEIPKFISLQKKSSKRYSIDRSLDELGVDEKGLRMQLANYYLWMKKQ